MSDQSSPKKLIFVDPGYLLGVGHYENYGATLRQVALRQGLEFEHFVNRRISGENARRLQLIRWFSYPATLSDSAFLDGDWIRHFQHTFASQLRAILLQRAEPSKFSGGIHLFMYTGHPCLLPVIGEVINLPELKQLDLRFSFNIFYVSNSFALKTGDPKYAEELLATSEKLESADIYNRVQLFADSHRTINIYERFFSRKISLLPIPLSQPTVTPNKAIAREPQIKLGFLGYTSNKQGYHFMLRLYRVVLARPEWQHVTLKLRHNVFKADRAVLADMRELIGSSERLESHMNYQTAEHLDRFISDCDLILIPHHREAYPLQTSGMFIDAVSRGKPVVVPENTWLSDQLASHGAGVTFSGTDFDSFESAVAQAILNIGTLREEAQTGTQTFADFHSPESLLNVIFLKDRLVTRAETRNKIEKSGSLIELLSLGLFYDHSAVADVIYQEKIARNKNLGWHYMLDLIWICFQIKDLPPGSTVLDAGAGYGLLQYVLVKLGMRVISVDFVPRKGPRALRCISVSAGEEFSNEYTGHLQQTYSISTERDASERVFSSQAEMKGMLETTSADIIFYRSDLASMSLLENESVDAVVSVSALEHNSMAGTTSAIKECLRVLKPRGVMLATTSASNTADWYHEPSKGWCYSEGSLRKMFELSKSVDSNFDEYSEIMIGLRELGNELHIQLAPFYFSSGNNGMPWGRWDPAYVPVGVRKVKGQ